MQDVTTIVVAVLGSSAFIEFTKYLIERHDSKKVTPEKLALRALCEDRLGELLREWLHSDVRYADDWRILENLYKGYEALGGNGEIRILFKEASEIKTTE